MPIAGLESYKRRRTVRINALRLACCQGVTLCMQPAKSTVMSDGKYRAISYQNASDHRIGLDPAQATKGVSSGKIEVRAIHHREGSGAISRARAYTHPRDWPVHHEVNQV
jgi:hypothetical protein